MQSVDPGGRDANSWPYDSWKQPTALLTAPQLETTATRVVTFAFPTIRLSAVADNEVNLAVPVAFSARCEVRLWIVTAAAAENGNVTFEMNAFPMTEGTAANIAALSPQTSTTTIAQPDMNMLTAIDLGVIDLDTLTALRITRKATAGTDTSTTEQDLVAVLFRDADVIQRP